jgi:rRNA maturation protein Nop10
MISAVNLRDESLPWPTISRMRCKSCHYSLKNLTEHRCPECGREFDPNDPSTFDPENRQWIRAIHLSCLFAGAFLIVWGLAGLSFNFRSLSARIFGSFAMATMVTTLLAPIVYGLYVLFESWRSRSLH